MSHLLDDALKSNSWPIQEAAKLLQKIGCKIPDKGYVLFETGYGPSGLPHIGTFGEVARTSMVINAFKSLSDIPVKLICFSDDMDGLRKVPDNIPSKEQTILHLGKPLTSIPDPFGTHASFGAHMNDRLNNFLKTFGFEYEFYSATECYKSGMFDQALLRALKKYDDIMKVMLPTLGAERQATYSPFLPICPETNIVLQVPLLAWDSVAGTISFNTSSGKEVTMPVTGGNCKMQWKADWALRWYALDVDFEMHGKDLMPSAELSTKICQILGKDAPLLYKYELFLDQEGKKISKSKGNGLSMDEWLRYAPTESLALYMYQSPNKAKKLFFDVIPKQVDEYIIYCGKYVANDSNNPLWHVHQGNVPTNNFYGINYSLLLNLASVCNPEDKSILWNFIAQYAPEANPSNAPFLDRLVECAVRYYDDFVKPNKKFHTPTEQEKIYLEQIKQVLIVTNNTDAEEIQKKIYDIGMASGIPLKDFFKSIYQILLGQEQGPRLGSFFKLFGIEATIKLIEEKLSN